MFIAEIGINHNGDIKIAKKLIDMAKRAKVDVVKFQKRDIDICIPNGIGDKLRQTPWGEMSYKEYKLKIEFSKKEYDFIDKYCKKINMKWTASVWDIPSLEFICTYDIPFIKIPSACITDCALLNEARKKGKPIIISTGMSTGEEVRNAVNILSKSNLTILHCNSSYPANDNELDLRVINTLKKMFPSELHPLIKIGYSGHEQGIMPSIIAKALGAEVIERHITLDKDMWGTDQKASLVEEELTELISSLNNMECWLGKDIFMVYNSENLVKSKLRRTIS